MAAPTTEMHVNLTKMLQDAYDRALAGDMNVIGIAVAVLLIFMTTLFLILRRGGSKGRAVLLVGLCDSGKTALYSRLVDGRAVKSHTSIKTNSASYKLKDGRSLPLVDIPGHERVRFRYLEEHKTSARALIYVVDSLSFQRELKDVAEYMYTILTDDVIASSAPPLLIACTKHDQTMAKGQKVIKGQLEKEINTLRTTRGATLDATSGTGNNNTFLGKKNKDFQFSDLKPLKVDFVECSSKKDGEIQQVEEWIHKVA